MRVLNIAQVDAQFPFVTKGTNENRMAQDTNGNTDGNLRQIERGPGRNSYGVRTSVLSTIRTVDGVWRCHIENLHGSAGMWCP